MTDIRRVDVFDDAQARAAFEVEHESLTLGRPWDDNDAYEPTVVSWRFDDPAEPMEMWAVYRGDEMAGLVTFWASQDDNTDKVWANVHVRPGCRRQGVGTALVGQLEQRMRELGRHEILTDSFEPPDSAADHPHAPFAAATGFVLESTDRARFLDLPLPDGLLDGLAEAARPHWVDAYRLETHENGLPDALVAGYCRVSNLLGVDAPTGAVEFEEETLTPKRYEEYLELERSQGRIRLTTVAVHEATGEVVAYTDLVLPDGAPTKVWQWGTLVDKAHRGHRLGTAVKVANLRRLEQCYPERTTVGTGNDETNRWMVDINEALGFRLVELCRMYRKVLPA